MGAKRPLNGTSKVNRQTDRQTDGQTFRLIESIGPEGRCFEKEGTRSISNAQENVSRSKKQRRKLHYKRQLLGHKKRFLPL